MKEELIQQSVPKSFGAGIGGPDARQWMDAVKSEHDALNRNNVYKWVVLPKEKKELPCKWLFNMTRKLDGSVDRYKARIVAGGHRQKAGIDFKETFTLVAKFISLRVLLTMVALEDLDGEQADIVTAFLCGELDEIVYMRVPEGLAPAVGDEYVDTDGSVKKLTKEDKMNCMVVKIVWCCTGACMVCNNLLGSSIENWMRCLL